MEIDTRKIRETVGDWLIRQFNDEVITVKALCDEIDRLRAKLEAGNNLCKKAQEHIGEVHERNARLTEEARNLANGREKAEREIERLTAEIEQLKKNSAARFVLTISPL